MFENKQGCRRRSLVEMGCNSYCTLYYRSISVKRLKVLTSFGCLGNDKRSYNAA